MGRLDTLERHLAKREWFQLIREAQNLVVQGDLTNDELGRLYRAWGRAKAGLSEPHAAVKLMELGLPWSLKAKDWDSCGFARADLGALNLSLGETQLGLNYLRSYLLDYHKYKEARGLFGKVHFNLAAGLEYVLNHEEAAQHYGKALDWFVEKGFAQEAGMVHQNLAWLLCTMRRPHEARPHLEAGDTYRDKLSSSFDAEQLVCWAYYYFCIGWVGDAIGLVQEILMTNRTGMASRHKGLAAWVGGQVSVLLGRREPAEMFESQVARWAGESQDPVVIRCLSQLREAMALRWNSSSEAAQQ